jgi:hypothetical protein
MPHPHLKKYNFRHFIGHIIVKGLESFGEGFRFAGSYRSAWTMSKKKFLSSNLSVSGDLESLMICLEHPDCSLHLQHESLGPYGAGL